MGHYADGVVVSLDDGSAVVIYKDYDIKAKGK
jgi:hypothetical protein